MGHMSKVRLIRRHLDLRQAGRVIIDNHSKHFPFIQTHTWMSQYSGGGGGIGTGIISPGKFRVGGGGEGGATPGNPKTPTASRTPQRASPCSVQRHQHLQIKLPVKAIYKGSQTRTGPGCPQPPWGESQLHHTTLHCTAGPPLFHQGKFSPPSLNTKFSHEILRPRNPPPLYTHINVCSG